MDVLLINTPAVIEEREYKGSFAFPLGIGYLYSYLESHGVNVGILDLAPGNISINDAAQIVSEKKPSLVGISFVTHNRFEAFNLTKEIKLLAPQIHVTLGGHHATNAPLDTMKNTLADSIVCGEGEATLYDLYIKLVKGNGKLSEVQGIYYRDGEGIKKSPERPLIQNLDSIGFPHRKSFCIKSYSLKMPEAILKKLKNQHFEGDNCAYIITSRGCKFKCTFCCASVTWKNQVRFHTARHTIDEIESLLKMGYNGIFIYDDFFTYSKKHVFSFYNEMKSRGLKVPLFCWARIDSVGYETFEKLKEVGLMGVSMGIESGSPKILNFLQKRQTPNMVLKAIKVLRDLDIVGKGTFIGMLPGESLRDTYYTAKLIDRIYEIQPEFIATPGYNIGLQIYPGTRIYEDLIKSNYFPKDFSWAKRYKEVPECLGAPVYRNKFTGTIKFAMKIMSKGFGIKRQYLKK